MHNCIIVRVIQEQIAEDIIGYYSYIFNSKGVSNA